MRRGGARQSRSQFRRLTGLRSPEKKRPKRALIAKGAGAAVASSL